MSRNTRTLGMGSCLLLVSLLVGAPQLVSAAPIFLSGDGNITDFSDVGNQQFFTNVLDGGTQVAVLQNSSPVCCESFDEDLSAFYNSLSGVTASTIVGTVTPAVLAGVDLFLSAIPDDAFTADELLLLGTFADNGGTIFFLGENSVLAPNNEFINDALAALGAGLTIDVATSFDGGTHTAVGSQIASDPFTTGVTSLTYAATSSVSGGKAIFYGTGERPFVAYVPEPSTSLLVVMGLLVVTARARGRR